MANPTAFGGAPYGFDPYGPNATFLLQGAIATTENVVRLYYSALPYLSGLLDPRDASQASFYAITPVAGSLGLDGLPPLPVSVVFAQVGADANSVELVLDRAMSPHPAQYQVTATGVWSSVSGAPGVLQNPDPGAATFDGDFRQLQPQRPENIAPSRDIANPTTLQGLQDAVPVVPLSLGASARLLGTYVVDASGDYASDQGLVSYKKRVLRRAITVPGAFAFLPRSYGVGIPSYGKKLASPALRARLAAAWQAQVLEEPETATAAVTAATDPANPGIVWFVLQATTKGGQKLNFRLPVPIQ